MSLCPQKAGIRLQCNIGRHGPIAGPIATKVQRSKSAYAPALVGVGYEWRIHDSRWQGDGKSERLRALVRTNAPLPGTGATQELGVGECRTLVAASHSSSKSV